MNTKRTLTEGNLALSLSQPSRHEAAYPYETEIIALPVRPAQRHRLAASQPMRIAPDAARVQAADPAARPAAQHRSAARSFVRSLATACVLLGVIGMLVTALWTVLHAESSAYAQALNQAERITISVAPGDSLWSIASEHSVDTLTTRQTTDLIRSWNDLDSSLLQPGMELLVPAES